MSSSELIIRQARVPVATTATNAASHPENGSVIRGRRFGLGSGGPSTHDGFGWPRSDGRHGVATSSAGGGREVGGAAQPAFGTTGSALLQVDLNDVRQRAEDRGYALGRARAEAELAAAIEACGVMAARIEALAPRESSAVAHALVAMSTAIARRVVGAELHLDPTLLVGALEAAVTAINGSPEALVLLHPDQLATVEAAWETTHGTAFLGKRWVFQADPSLEPGGCVLRYEHGFVAAGLEAQIDLIAAALEEAIPGLPHGRTADAAMVEP